MYLLHKRTCNTAWQRNSALMVRRQSPLGNASVLACCAAGAFVKGFAYRKQHSCAERNLCTCSKDLISSEVNTNAAAACLDRKNKTLDTDTAVCLVKDIWQNDTTFKSPSQPSITLCRTVNSRQTPTISSLF